MFRNLFIRWLAVSAIALTIGVIGAFARSEGSQSQPAVALAWTHCTRYHPSTAVDVNCGVSAYYPSGWINEFTTSGHAARDSNVLYISVANSWQLWYIKYADGSSIGWQAGFGQNGAIGSSNGYQAYAWCRWWTDNSPANYNQCTTYWH